MYKKYFKWIFLLFFTLSILLATAANVATAKDTRPAKVRGIYLTQWTLEKTDKLNYLIKRAKDVGIDTFVVDLEIPSKRYRDNIALVKESGIRYVARIVMFPNGGTKQQVENPEVWQKKYALVKQAIEWGANSIQLDYIRYNTKQPPSPENAKHIHDIIKWYKTRLSAQNVPLEIDVFGIASYGESKYIGQNIKLFSDSVDAICPMVYPSHYQPFYEHYQKPYDTIADSLASIQDQFDDEKKFPVKLIPYIELSNYHFPMTHEKRVAYIRAQIEAVNDTGADGYYVWSAHNEYPILFEVLESR